MQNPKNAAVERLDPGLLFRQPKTQENPVKPLEKFAVSASSVLAGLAALLTAFYASAGAGTSGKLDDLGKEVKGLGHQISEVKGEVRANRILMDRIIASQR